MPEVMDKLKICVKYSEIRCAADFSANSSNMSSPDDLCALVLHRA